MHRGGGTHPSLLEHLAANALVLLQAHVQARAQRGALQHAGNERGQNVQPNLQAQVLVLVCVQLPHPGCPLPGTLHACSASLQLACLSALMGHQRSGPKGFAKCWKGSWKTACLALLTRQQSGIACAALCFSRCCRVRRAVFRAVATVSRLTLHMAQPAWNMQLSAKLLSARVPLQAHPPLLPRPHPHLHPPRHAQPPQQLWRQAQA